jgi:hypothetical protein
MVEQIPAVEDANVEPVCPYCEQPVKKICVRPIESTFGRRYLYFCCLCRKVLGVSHRKGFWMG